MQRGYGLLIAVVAALALGAVAALPSKAAATAAVPVSGPPTLVSDYAAAIEAWGEEPTTCDSVLIAEGETGPGILAYANRETPACTIVVAPGLPQCSLPRLVEHEVGHLLGYGHSTDPSNVMYATEDVTACETSELAAEGAEAELPVLARKLRHVNREIDRCQHACRRHLGRLRRERRLAQDFRETLLAQIPAPGSY